MPDLGGLTHNQIGIGIFDHIKIVFALGTLCVTRTLDAVFGTGQTVSLFQNKPRLAKRTPHQIIFNPAILDFNPSKWKILLNDCFLVI